MKDRADKIMVKRGLFESRASARAAIEAGHVRADGVLVTKSSQMMSEDAEIDAMPAHPYVSRAGLKLAHALDVFGVNTAGRQCLDIGASTGGFTQVLLQREASHVTAVDVGRGQLHAMIASDKRVLNLEATDARDLTAEMLPAPPGLLVCDASFIALEKLLAVPLSLASPDAEFVGLFKPQFQVGRSNIGKGGIVSNPAATNLAAERFSNWMMDQGWPVQSWTASPILGGDGNAERLFHAVRDQ